MLGISSQPLVSECIFTFCHADDDGGGLSLWNSVANDKCICKDSIFLKNTCGDYGAGIILWDNDNRFKCSNILFTQNTAKYGAAYTTNKLTAIPNYILSFCFFNKNTGTYGSDIWSSSTPDPFPLLHCSSTSSSSRIYNDNDNWLP